MFANYAIIARPEIDLLHITLSGFFDPAKVMGFDAARRAAHQQLTCPPNQHDTLVDVRGLQLQAQHIVEAFRTMIADPKTRARRLAIVTGDAAIRMQVRRVIARDDMCCFADLPAAERWLAASRPGLALAG